MINENDFSVIVVPDTPQKNPPAQLQGLSSQILPLSRLSMSSSNASSSPPNPVSELEQNNNNLNSNKKQESPVREKLDKFRRSFTEPLLQYFHELQVSPESEEPEVLNTPKSILQSPSSPKVAGSGPKSKRSRNLLAALQGSEEDTDKDGDSGKEYENMPPIIITDM